MARTQTDATRTTPRTAAKTSRAGSPKTPPRVTVVVSAAMRSRYERLLAAFKRAQGAELVQWDAAYEAIDAILSAEPPLYLAGGFKSARAFADAVLPGITLDTIRDNARVARYFDPDAEKKHGVARLALLLDYLEAKNGGALPALRVDPDRTKVLQKKVAVPFTSLSYDDLRDVVRAAKGRPRRDAKEPAVVRLLREEFSTQGLGNVSLSLRDGRWTFGRVEARQFKDLGAALTRASKPRRRRGPSGRSSRAAEPSSRGSDVGVDVADGRTR